MAGSQGLLLWGGISFIYFLKIQISSSQEDKLLVATGASPAEAGTLPPPSPIILVRSLSSGSHFRLRKGWTPNRRIAPLTPTLPPLAPKWPIALPTTPQGLTDSTSHLQSPLFLFRSGQHPPEGRVDKNKPSLAPQDLGPPKVIWKSPTVAREPQGCYRAAFHAQIQQPNTTISCPFWRQLGSHWQKDLTLPPPRRRRPQHHHGSRFWFGPSHVATLTSPAASHRSGKHNDSIFHPLSFIQQQLTTTATTTQPSTTGFLQGQSALLQTLLSTRETTMLPHPEPGRPPTSCQKLKVTNINFGGWRPQRRRQHLDLEYRHRSHQSLYNLVASVASPAPTEEAKVQDTTTSLSLISRFSPWQSSSHSSHSTSWKVGKAPHPDSGPTLWAQLKASPSVPVSQSPSITPAPTPSSSGVRRLKNFQDLHLGYPGSLKNFPSVLPGRTISFLGHYRPYLLRPQPVILPPFALRRSSSSRGILGPPGLRRGKPIYSYLPSSQDKLAPLVIPTSIMMNPSLPATSSFSTGLPDSTAFPPRAL